MIYKLNTLKYMVFSIQVILYVMSINEAKLKFTQLLLLLKSVTLYIFKSNGNNLYRQTEYKLTNPCNSLENHQGFTNPI